jgi:hypothetical protein
MLNAVSAKDIIQPELTGSLLSTKLPNINK